MDKLTQAVSDILDTLLGYCRQEDGTFSYEIYADYRDEMDSKTAIKILQSEDPELAFWEQLEEWYEDYRWTLESELEKEILDKLTAPGGPYPEGFSDGDDAALRDVLLELVCFELPEDHFIKQSFYVNIMLDTGDGNYDYTLNSAYPCWYGSYRDPIDAKGSTFHRGLRVLLSPGRAARARVLPRPRPRRYRRVGVCPVDHHGQAAHGAPDQEGEADHRPYASPSRPSPRLGGMGTPLHHASLFPL